MLRTRPNEQRTTLDRLDPPCGPGLPRRWRPVLVAAVCVVLAGGLSSCGQENPSGAAPLGERAENDVPLNPPTLRFHVSADGHVNASPDLEAEAGEAVAVVLENESDTAYELRLLGPEGGQVYAVEAPPGGRGDGRALPRDAGPHFVEVHPVGEPGPVEEFPIEVSEN